MTELAVKKLLVPGPGAMDRLMEYAWPGNVRELENMVERAMILRKGEALTFEDNQTETPREVTPSTVIKKGQPLTLDEAMARHIEEVLKICGRKVEGKGSAAELLGMNPSTLRNRMRKLHIRFGRQK